MRSVFAALTVAPLLLIGSLGASHAQQPLAPAGVLECRGGPSVGLVVGSETHLLCVLHRPRHRHVQRYTAIIHRVGVDLGVTDTWALAWDVLTPTGRVPRGGGISGNYGGAGSSISIGTGAATNAVIGGPGNAVSLQPRQVPGVTGVSLAFGFQGMDLRRGG